MDYMRSPSVAILYAVTEDGIARHMLSQEYTISDDDSVCGMDRSASNTGSTSGYSRVKAFAARKGKDDHSHTQCQDESQ